MICFKGLDSELVLINYVKILSTCDDKNKFFQELDRNELTEDVYTPPKKKEKANK
jgi:hypothetical protein